MKMYVLGNKRRDFVAMRWLFFLLLLSLATFSVRAGEPRRNGFTLGLDGPFGGIGRDKVVGAMLRAGYSIAVSGTDFLSIEPRLGAGGFWSRKTDLRHEAIVWRYRVSSIVAGIASRAQWAVNGDNTPRLFVEGEFSLMEAFAAVDDAGTNRTRNVDKLLPYGTLRLGLAFNLGERNVVDFWCGVSSLSFNGLVNTKLPTGHERYSGQAAPLAVGIGIHL